MATITIEHEELGSLEIDYSVYGQNLKATMTDPAEYIWVEVNSVELDDWSILDPICPKLLNSIELEILNEIEG